MTQVETHYEAPKLQLVGKVEDVTLGNHTGNFSDANFPVHTPENQLTFS